MLGLFFYLFKILDYARTKYQLACILNELNMIYVYVYTYAYAYVYMYTCIYVYMYICIYVYMSRS